MLSVLCSRAAWYSFAPYSVKQADQSTLECYISGDEYYSWLHDKEGYTILEGNDGFYYYAEPSPTGLIPGKYKAGNDLPAESGLQPWAGIPESDYMSRRSNAAVSGGIASTSPHSGLVNNLVIYIRFADDPEFATSRQQFETLFNSSDQASLKSYYSEASYNQLNLTSSHFPASPQNINRSYRDSHNRGYFQPYHASSNPQGYSNEQERISREHNLLKSAVEWVIINSPIPQGLNLDADNDGKVDNICFVSRGSASAWSQLLWSHSWQLFSFPVLINGKQVWGYNFVPENQSDVRTLCHEMFHSLGAPDLYHYVSNGLQPVGDWDIMESGLGHMGSWMKWKYSNHGWISEIPEISHSGTYTINPLSSPTDQCYLIPSPHSGTEFFVIEYRRKTGLFESSLPGSGLLIYRIDTTLNGNAAGPPDEVYIYRPNGTRSSNGSPDNAFFTLDAGRTSINDGSNPACFLQDGSAGGLQIYDIGSCGETISFSVAMNDIDPPASLVSSAIVKNEMQLEWQGNAENDPVMLVGSTDNNFGIPIDGLEFPIGSQLPGGGMVLYSGSDLSMQHTGLGNHEEWHYQLFSVSAGFHYSNPIQAEAITLCGSVNLPYSMNFNAAGLPDCSSLQHSGSGCIDNWDVSNTQYAGGSGKELRSTFQQVSGGVSRFVLPAIDSRGMNALALSFRHTLDDWAAGATLRIQSSSDGVNWTNESWSLSSSSNITIGPVIVNTGIHNNLNSEATYIAFTVEGNLYQYDFWYLDDINLSCSSRIPVTITAQPYPPSAGACSGAGTYPSGQAVELSATPSSGWEFLNWSENGSVVSADEKYAFNASDRSLLASFSQTEATVGVTAFPAGSGNWTGSGTYTRGTEVIVAASPVLGYVFDGWWVDGEKVSSESSYAFTLLHSVQFEARFSRPAMNTYAISLISAPTEGGISEGAGIAYEGELYTVFAIPYAGWIFDSWQENGIILSFQPAFTFAVHRAYNLKAVFKQVLTIHAYAYPEEAGYAQGGGDYLSGQMVNLQAIPNQGWRFYKWLLNGQFLSQDSALAFLPQSDCNVQATFVNGLDIQETGNIQASVYPNPSNGNLCLRLNDSREERLLRIYSVSGALLIQQSLPPGSLYPQDFSQLGAGVYLASITTAEGKSVQLRFVLAGGR
ncbi:MAG: M6 family metalloprotease domain-containing protein [Bacteroidales bacterium]|nr:M6 family metalloprotease domain-containing protein [Bacteroidales bacterium]